MRRLVSNVRRDEGGFGLIEMVVALLIAGIVFGALATTLIAAVRSSVYSRQNQQATDYMTQAIEELRLMSYGSLSVDASLLSGDPSVVSCAAGPLCIDVGGSVEAIVTASIAGVSAVDTLHDAQTNETTFTLRRYVTAVDGTGTDLVRRVTVSIEWTFNGKTHTRSTSTVIAYSQRGLPLPYFTLKPATSTVSINPGATVVHTYTLENKGAPDRWNLTLSGSATGFSLHADTDNSGDYDDGIDALLTDTSGDGVVDTGRIQPGTTFRFYLVRVTSVSTPLATLTTNVTARSVAQPTASTASATATATTVIVSGAVAPTVAPTPTPSGSGSPSPSPSATDVVCALGSVPASSPPTGYTAKSYALHNKGLSTSTTLAQLDMNGTAPSNSALGTYSTDQSATLTGRQVVASATSSSAALLALSGPTSYADWSMDLGAKLNISGGSVVQVWVAAPAGAVSGASVPVVLYSTNSAGGNSHVLAYTSGTVTSGCAGFQQVAVQLPSMSAQQVSKNSQLHVRVALSTTLRLGYDATMMPASLTVNVK